MKPESLHGSDRQSLPHRHPLRAAIRRIVLAGGIAMVVVGAAVELIAALVTGAWPTGTAHVIAALLALVLGCVVVTAIALGLLAQGVEVSVDRLTANVRALSASVAGAAGTAIAIERQHIPTLPGTDGSNPLPSGQATRMRYTGGVMSGMLAGVEHDVYPKEPG